MNIYWVSIHEKEGDKIFNTYIGEALTMEDAISKAIKIARVEGCEEPVVAMIKLEGKKAF